LRSRITGTDSKGLKRLGQANLYFVGSVAEATALSIPADVLCFDEFDRLDVTHLAKFEQRLAAPTSLKLIRRFSNPSFPETGIDERYLASDQRSWLVCCARCRYEAPLVYASGDDNEHFVDEGVADRVCGRCHRPLAAEAIASGRWVPRHPRIRARGYHVSKLIVPSQDIGELIAERARTDEDAVMAHHNFSLGLPYAPRGGSLSSDMVKACRRQWTCPNSYGGKNWVTAGVDVGKALHVRISEWRSNGIAIPLFLGEICAGDSTRDFAELANLWRRYNVNFGVIDERPEERAAREFMREFPGRCVLARWAGDAQHDDIVMDGEQGLLLARRTWACDRTVDAFSRQVKYLPASLPSSYVKQMTAPHKVVETAKGGQKVPRYVSDGRADHYFFAETYDLLARERMPTPPAGAWGDPPEPLRRSIFR
jgi:hypothetical protein